MTIRHLRPIEGSVVCVICGSLTHTAESCTAGAVGLGDGFMRQHTAPMEPARLEPTDEEIGRVLGFLKRRRARLRIAHARTIFDGLFTGRTMRGVFAAATETPIAPISAEKLARDSFAAADAWGAELERFAPLEIERARRIACAMLVNVQGSTESFAAELARAELADENGAE